MKVDYTNTEMNPDAFVSLSPDTVQEITRSLSDTALLILKNLYAVPYMRQKDLAAVVHCSASNLSNHLSKMSLLSVPLIIGESRGRDKHFSLTPIGKAYMQIKEKEDISKESFLRNHNTVFGEHEHYIGLENMSMGVDNTDTKDRVNLSPLIELEMNNSELLYQVIDSVFSNLCLAGFPARYSDKECYSSMLTDEQYYAIYFSLSKIIHHCLNNHLSREEILFYIKEKLGKDNTVHMRYYIAAIIYSI